VAYARDADQDQQREARDQQPRRDALPHGDRRDQHGAAEGAAEQHREELALEVEVRVAGQPLRDVQGSGRHHDEPGEQQPEDGDQDDRVERKPLLAAGRARILQ
jgi:hypothetical protein